ncbi:hypothetical protein [Mangrovimonas sp. DI 80]|uniref:hypothetical protein n=1 Tax=Mangrovimonas sp. DI 80 TaxID=1779330 RepID=UPI000F504726|nr:hypothetical protein [Mangrovimonas sp. DI 80]
MNVKRLLKLLLLCPLLVCCTSKKNVYIRSELLNKIETIIEKYQEFVLDTSKFNRHDPEVYEVQFFEYEGKCHISINTNINYQSKLNGFTFIHGKLVTFNYTSSKCNEGWVTIYKAPIIENLKNYKNENDSLDNYQPAFWEFIIDGDKLIPARQNKLEINFE